MTYEELNNFAFKTVYFCAQKNAGSCNTPMKYVNSKNYVDSFAGSFTYQIVYFLTHGMQFASIRC